MDTEINKRIETRAVTAEDHDFLLRVYAAGRDVELAMLPLDEDGKRAFCEHQLTAQTSYYAEKFPNATHDIIMLNGEPVGRAYVDRGSKTISILDLAVLVEHRRKGIGTQIVKSIQNEAGLDEKRVGVYVETFNPSQKFFRDLGFDLAESDEMNLYFVWNPSR